MHKNDDWMTVYTNHKMGNGFIYFKKISFEI